MTAAIASRRNLLCSCPPGAASELPLAAGHHRKPEPRASAEAPGQRRQPQAASLPAGPRCWPAARPGGRLRAQAEAQAECRHGIEPT